LSKGHLISTETIRPFYDYPVQVLVVG